MAFCVFDRRDWLSGIARCGGPGWYHQIRILGAVRGNRVDLLHQWDAVVARKIETAYHELASAHSGARYRLCYNTDRYVECVVPTYTMNDESLT